MVLEITPTTPLSHGAGNRGNEQILRTTEYLVHVVDPDTLKRVPRKINVPTVSGSAMRATLREHAFGHLAESIGIQDGSVNRDALRLLLKGGKNDSGGQSVSLEEHRRLRILFPMLAVFGSMDGGMPVRGQLQVSPVRPFCQELVDAGLVPRALGALTVSADGEELVSAPQLEVYPDVTPVPLHMVRTREEYFRHDMLTSPHVHYLEGEAAKQIEDAAAERKGKVAKKDERREANESMPHTMQAIAPGTPMVAELRLLGATQVEWECLAYAITRWIAHGATLGGATGKGHGRCSVHIRGALAYSPPSGGVASQPGTALSMDRLGSAYLAHLEAHAAEIRERLGVPVAA